MQTAYEMLTTSITTPLANMLADLRNTQVDAGCLEKGMKRTVAEIGFTILAVVALIETVVRAILSLPFRAVECVAGDKSPQVIVDLANSPIRCALTSLVLLMWMVKNIYQEQVGDSSDSNLTDIFPCMQPCIDCLPSDEEI